MLYSFHNGNLAGEIILDSNESHHLVSVRRAREGETVTVLNGGGASALCRVVNASTKAAVLKVDSVQTRELGIPPVWLAQAMPLGKTMESIVQKAAELGTARILPLCTERSELRMDAARTARKVEKWKLTAVEAVKQCGNPFLPQISEPLDVKHLPDSSGLPAARLVCSLEDNAQELLEILPSMDCSTGVVIAIGPEGDFSPDEYRQLGNSGFRPVSLGPLVLRSDTAATAALAVVTHQLRARNTHKPA